MRWATRNGDGKTGAGILVSADFRLRKRLHQGARSNGTRLSGRAVGVTVDLKKPGVAFWATVTGAGLVAVAFLYLAYVVYWLIAARLPGWGQEMANVIYAPLIWLIQRFG